MDYKRMFSIALSLTVAVHAYSVSSFTVIMKGDKIGSDQCVCLTFRPSFRWVPCVRCAPFLLVFGFYGYELIGRVIG